jgi:hypothetical protein
LSRARGVKAPLPQAKPSGFGFVHRFFRLWDWYDLCLGRVKSAREWLDQHGSLPDMPIDKVMDAEDRSHILTLVYDSLGNMEAAFSISSRMVNVHAAEYADIEAVLAKRNGRCAKLINIHLTQSFCTVVWNPHQPQADED